MNNYSKIYKPKENSSQSYYWFEKGFSDEELKLIEKNVEKIPDIRATTVTESGEEENSVRKSKIKWVPQNEEWDWLYEKLMNMANEANEALWRFEIYTAPESIQYTQYFASEGGHYDWHQDIGPGALSTRKISITVQLSESEEYEGGDLQISQGANHSITTPRGKGNVILFPSYMPHRVTKVTKGTRKSFVLWLGGGHYK